MTDLKTTTTTITTTTTQNARNVSERGERRGPGEKKIG